LDLAPGKAIYLFCFARADLFPASLDLEGMDDGSPLLQHRRRDIAAVLSEVSLEEFTGPESEARLKDLGWLAPRALKHEQVIEQIARRSPVFPARFGTIFSTLAALEDQVAAHEGAIREFLERTRDAEEWGLKGYLDRGKAQEHVVDEEMAHRAAQLASSPGLRYMQERRLRGEADAKVSRWLRETAAGLKERLSERALEATERKLLSAASAEAPGEMVLNWAFLVPKAGVKEFRSLGEQIARSVQDWGLFLEAAGPFPPYSFTPGLERRKR
jgi:hypothetical protein